MTSPHDYESLPCALCGKPSRYRVHTGCQNHIDENLDYLPALYRRLAEVLTPGRAGGDRRASTKHPPLPVNLAALDLRARGGIEGILRDWAQDVYDREGWTGFPLYANVEVSVIRYVEILRANLNGICDTHPAVKDFAQDINRAVGAAERLITGEKPERPIAVVCGCGTVIRFTLSAPGRRCGGCDAQYGWAELRDLPLAERSAA